MTTPSQISASNVREGLTAAAVRDLIMVGLSVDLVRLIVAVPGTNNLRAALILLTLKVLTVELLPFLLLRSGRVKAAAWTLATSATILSSFYVVISGGLASSAVFTVMALTCSALVLLGRAGFIVAGACLALLMTLAAMAAQGISLPQELADTATTRWINYAGGLAFAVFPIVRAMERLRKVDSDRNTLLRQVTSERQLLESAQNALRVSETLYRGISENSPVGVFRTNTSGEVVYANPRLLEIWDLPWDLLKGRGFVSRMHPDDQGWVIHKMTSAPGTPRSCDFRLALPNGVRWVSSRATPVFDAQGNYDGDVGSIVDTTQSVEMTERLRDKETYMRAILDSEPECVKTIAPDGTLVEMNPAGLAMLEADSEDQVVGKVVASLVDASHREAFLEMHRRVLAGETGMIEHRILGRKGTARWLETHAAPLRDGSGKVIAAVAVSRDISDRKAREESQRRFESVQASAHIGAWDWDPRQPRLHASQENLRLFGFPPASAPEANDYLNRVHLEDRAAIETKLKRSLVSGDEFKAEFRVSLPDGGERWIHSQAEISRENGIAVRLVGFNQDITSRKLWESDLRESEENLRALFDYAPYGAILVDPEDFSIVRSNQLVQRQLGYTAEELLRLGLTGIAPDGPLDPIRNAARSNEETTPAQFETTCRTKDDRARETLVSTSPLHIGGKTLVYLAVQDVTERNLAARELQSAETRERILAELSGDFWTQMADPIAALANSVRKLQEEFADLCAVRLLSPDGSSLEPPSVAFGESMRVGTVQEILCTPLRTSDDYFHQRVARTGQSHWIPNFDPERHAELLPPTHRNMVRLLKPHSMLAVPLRAENRVIGVMTVARHNPATPPLNQQDLTFVQEVADRAAIAMTASQLTLDLRNELKQRRAMEAERDNMVVELQRLTNYLEAAREDERRRISREIHDELGQQLIGLKMRFDFLFRAPLKPGEADEQKTALQADLEAAIRSVRQIATGLRPAVLDSLGPAAALEWLGRDFQDRFGIPCHAHVQTFPTSDLIGTTLFRVAQEALTNCAKHAHASQVWLNCFQHSGSIWLEVTDDGVGIQEAGLRTSDRFGLIGMRERAALVGGSLMIGRLESGGTELRLRLPSQPEDAKHEVSHRG